QTRASTRVRAGIPQPHALHREVSARVRWLQTGSTLSITMSPISPLGDGDLDVRTVAEAAANAPARPQSLRRCRGASGGAACGDDSPVGGEHLRGDPVGVGGGEI